MPISQETINRGGSKLEITRAIIESRLWSDVPVPNSVWLYHNDAKDPKVVAEAAKELHGTLIVRGSHPNDYHGYIDVIPTHRDVRRQSELEKAVQDILTKTASDATRVHAEDWGQPFTPEVHLLIQEQSPSTIMGSMLRHPHDRRLRIQYVDIKRRFGNGRDCFSVAEELEGKRLLHVPGTLKILDLEILALIGMYEILERSGILDPEWSYQVEFGLRPMMFFQARPFKKFEPAHDFKIPDFQGREHPYMEFHEVFGITPAEGVRLGFCAVYPENLYADTKALPEAATGQEYGMILTEKFVRSYPLDTRLGNLRAFCSPCLDFDYLGHGNYRFMKRAAYSFIQFDAKNVPQRDFHHSPGELAEFRDSTFFCNGAKGVLVPTRYL